MVFSTCLSLVLITIVSANGESAAVANLGGTTALLLLAVFTVVHVCVLVLRRDPVEHRHFRAHTAVPWIGLVVCAYLVTPLVDRDPQQYAIAGGMLGLGVLLWAVNHLAGRGARGARTTGAGTGQPR